MDEALHNDDLLIRYLDGELSPQEKEAVEDRLRTDKALRERMVNLQVAVHAVKQFGTGEKVQFIHAEMMNERKGKQVAKVVSFAKVVRYSLAIAASLVVLFFGVRLYTNAQLSPEKIYDQSFVDFNVSTARGSNDNLSQIEKHYQQKAYGAVINDLRSAGLSAKDSLLIGLAYLHQNRPEQAGYFFQKLVYSSNDYQQDAEFYLSLSELKTKEYGKALTMMQKIRSTPSHLYREQLTDDVVEKVKKLSNR